MFDNSNLNSVNPNTSTYRIERGTFQTDNKAHRLYMVRTGNVFTNKQTYSRKTANEWAAAGEKVLICNTRGRVVGRLAYNEDGRLTLQYYASADDKTND